MPYVADPDLAAFLQVLPKTETHLHLEGALPWELRSQVASNRGLKALPSWEDHYRFPTFQSFLDMMIENYQDWYVSAERYAESAALVFYRLLEQNVRYLEFSIDAFTSDLNGISLQENIRGILAQVPRGLEARLFVGFHRDGHSEGIKKTAYACLEWPEVSGIDIHDVETRSIAPWLQDLYREARRAGKVTKAHAGEFGDAGYVKDAIDFLEVDRIEHGIRAADDPAVTAFVKERDLTLDICPISNVKLKACASMAEHPIRTLFDAGIRCTISTDDPLIFGNRLTEEYIALAQELNFSRKDLIQIARNGWSVALIDDSDRETVLKTLDRLEAALAG